MESCTGKTALVTNASRVPGKAVAQVLARAGARVLLHDSQSATSLEPLVDAILTAGGLAKAAVADMSTPAGTHQLAQQTRAVIGDRLDILVIDVDAADSRAPYRLVELFEPILTAGSNVIVMRSGPASLRDDESLKRRAKLLEARGVRVNAVACAGADVAQAAATVLYLVSDASGGMTGMTLGDARVASPSAAMNSAEPARLP